MNKKRTGRFIALALLLAGLCSTAQAQNAYWLNITAPTNWSSSAIWTPVGGAPAGIAPGTGATKDDIALMSRHSGNTAGSRVTTNDVSISLGGLYIGTTANVNGKQTLSAVNGSTITFTNTTGGSAFIIKTNNTGTTAIGIDVINTPIVLGSNLAISNRSSYGGLTINGAISQSGDSQSVTIGNDSTNVILMTASNSYSGGTTLTGGKLTVNDKDGFGTGAVTINNGGSATITLSGDDMKNNIANNGEVIAGGNAIFSGNLSGNGSLYHNGSGAFTMTLRGDNSAFSGAITNAGGFKFDGAKALGTATVYLGDGINTGSFGLEKSTNATGVNAVKNNIILSGDGNTVGNNLNTLELAGVISGSANLGKNGLGALILSGINTYSGNTTVNAGKLIVNGVVVSPLITVSNGATLGGTGLVQAVTVNAGGVLSAANTNSPGTLTFTADASLEAGSTNIMEIYSASLYDVLKGSVSNTLTLAGENIIDFTGWTTPGVANGTTFALFQNWSSINTTGGTFTFVNLGNLGLTDDQILVATGNGFAVSSKSAPNILLLY
jgi:autotransporter-associated beta strand protein